MCQVAVVWYNMRMNAQNIRQAYLTFFADRGHTVIPRASLVLQNDPTTLFTGSGMQPLLPYLLGQEHPQGNLLVDSQTSFRAQDIDEVGDNRHTVFFEMLGNWSLGDYFKAQQLPWIFEFLTDVVGLDPKRLFVTCFQGDATNGIPRDTDSASIWKGLFAAKDIQAGLADMGSEENGASVGMPEGTHIFFYDATKNWWCRAGKIDAMPAGEPGGPDSEMFYEFSDVEHNAEFGPQCHPNCDCGRYMEIGNSVFMEYVKTETGFIKLPKQNVDFGGGLERIAAASLDSPDVFQISILKPIIDKLESISGMTYAEHTESMRVIADHLRAATFLAVDGVVPSNKEQGYVMRRLMRRAIRYAFELGIEQNFLEQLVPVIADMYHIDFPEVAERRDRIIEVLVKEEKAFRQTLRKGLKELESNFAKGYFAKPALEYDTTMATKDEITEKSGLWVPAGNPIRGELLFMMYDTYGFPLELSLEEASQRNWELNNHWRDQFDIQMAEQRQRSQTATKGTFKGGLGGQTEQHKKYHTATHLMYQSLRTVLGDHVVQHGSNITEERLRFDFSHPEKMTLEQIILVEDMVNEQINNDLTITWEEHPTKEAIEELHVLGAFGDRYGEVVKCYRMQKPGAHKPFSFEICGGPHVDHTSQLAEGGKRFTIKKEESSSSGIRRIKAVLA